MTWQPQWPDSSSVATPAVVAELFKEADLLSRNADSQGSLEAAVTANLAVLKADPAHYQACVTLAHLYLLLGDAYQTSMAGKRNCFQKALLYSELAMYTNPSFKESIQRGEPTWEACQVLGFREMEAMLFWANAVFYRYKEGQGPLGQIVNFRWIQRATQVMDHMTSIDPDWGGGVIHLTWGIYFLAIPESVGGDRVKSAEYFRKAIEIGPEQLIHRWGRAKYYHVKMKDPQSFREDLKWVLSRDLRQSPGHPAWNAFFVKDARRLLNTIDRQF